MEKQDIIKYCLSLQNTLEDYPFPDDNFTVAMKHTNNKRWFVLIMNVNKQVYLNIKTNPEYSDLLRNYYDYIIPAYHMNKEHWNTIMASENVDIKLVKELIKQSYELTIK